MSLMLLPTVLLIIAEVKTPSGSQPRVHRGAGRPWPPGRSGRTSTRPPAPPVRAGAAVAHSQAGNGAELGLEQGSLWGPNGAWLVETRTPRRTERLGFGEPRQDLNEHHTHSEEQRPAVTPGGQGSSCLSSCCPMSSEFSTSVALFL